MIRLDLDVFRIIRKAIIMRLESASHHMRLHMAHCFSPEMIASTSTRAGEYHNGAIYRNYKNRYRA